MPFHWASAEPDGDRTVSVESHFGHCPLAGEFSRRGNGVQCYASDCTGKPRNRCPFCTSCWATVPKSIKTWIRKQWPLGHPAPGRPAGREYREACESARIILRDGVPRQSSMFPEDRNIEGGGHAYD